MLKQPIYLEWDSAFFLLKTGKIEYTCFDEDNIYEIIENARNSAYKLLYIFCKKDFYFSENVKHKYNIKLVDRKIVYKRNLEGRSYQNYADEYKLNVLVNELEELAYASGKHSRFYIDKNIDKKYFYRLYRTWIEKSITKEMANKIFIKRNGGGGGITGMVTLKYKENYSEIGLLAVNEHERKKGIGRDLMNKCFEESIENSLYQINVTTQIDNKIACKFYEKCGFTTDTITNIYHLWL